MAAPAPAPAPSTAPAGPAGPAAPAGPAQATPVLSHTPAQTPPTHTPVQTPGPSAKAESSPSHPDLATVQALLGPEITSWNFSDASLKAALELRTERERSRQEYYKLETRKRSAELLQEAMRYNLPSSLLPLLFNGAPPLPTDMDETPSSSSSIPEYVNSFAKQHEQRYSSPSTHHHTHQRNLSLPQQPTIIQSEYQRQQPPPPPPPQQQPPPKSNKFRHHAHHASTSAIPQTSYYSPTRAPAAPLSFVPPLQPPPATTSTNTAATAATARQSASRPAWQTTPNTYFPPPQNPYPPNPGSPTTSVHHIIQFHHWQPNQTKPSGTTSPTRKEEDAGSKRRRSLTGESGERSGERSGSPATASTTASTTSSTPSTTAVASAAAHSRRKSMHNRNKSETSAIRGDMSKFSISGPPRIRTPEDTAGFNYLAQAAAEESARLASPEKRAPSTEARSHKQDVNFMITD